jgi:hypothetical protein
MAGIDVLSEVLVARPRAEVARFMFDPTNDTRWTEAVIRSRALADGPLRPGVAVERTVRFLGREFVYVFTCLAHEPERSVELDVKKPFPMQVTYSLEDAPGGTKVSIRNRGDASGFFGIASALMAPMVRRNVQKDLERLKAAVESA